MALRSVGYDSDSIKSDANAFASIQNGRLPDYCAILVGEPVTTEVADEIMSYRAANAIPVIRLMTSGNDESFPYTVDESVPKSNPRQLIVLLNRLLNPASEVIHAIPETGFDSATHSGNVELQVG